MTREEPTPQSMLPESSQADFVGVVVAAGTATRFGGDTPKQFCDLAGRTVLEHSVRALTRVPGVRGAVVTLAASECAGPRAAQVRSWPGVLDVVPGGETRLDSVGCGIAALPDAPYVLVHDAARPLASRQLIEAVMQATRRHGACVPALPVPDTVKQVNRQDEIETTVDRRKLRLAQTPQGARVDWLRQALDQVADSAAVTDESLALELAGRRVATVPGESANRKITTQEDLDTANRLLVPSPTYRVGTGFDVHRLGADRTLVLGGVEFPGEPGLIGHSDADVILHAAMDALLGAAALGDIGMLFPPEDEAFAGVDSRELARDVAGRIRDRGYEIVNVDITVLAERPRLRERNLEMREAIATCLGLATDQVGLKATTMEQLGTLGRGEGIACQASACLKGS